MEKLLIQIGLSDKEAATYLKLLELGSGSVQKIAGATGIKRVTMYVIIDRLKQFGLVNELGEGKKVRYRAAHPSSLEKDPLRPDITA